MRPGRFRDLIVKAILERARIIDEEAGYAPGKAPRGWSWADDNCALLSPDMYRFFGYPILESVFSRYAPNPGDSRYQHSDSAMGHLLPILGELGLTRVNFGPSLSVREIREHLPDAVIHGQLAPLTLSRNEEVNIVAETIREKVRGNEHPDVAALLNNLANLYRDQSRRDRADQIPGDLLRHSEHPDQCADAGRRL